MHDHDPLKKNPFANEDTGYESDVDYSNDSSNDEKHSPYFDPFEDDLIKELDDTVETQDDILTYNQQRQLFLKFLHQHQSKEKLSAVKSALKIQPDKAKLTQQLEIINQMIADIDRYTDDMFNSKLPRNIKNKLYNTILKTKHDEFVKLENELDNAILRCEDKKPIEPITIKTDLAPDIATSIPKNLSVQAEIPSKEQENITKMINEFKHSNSYARKLSILKYTNNESALDKLAELRFQLSFLNVHSKSIKDSEHWLLQIANNGIKTKQIKNLITELYKDPKGDEKEILLNLIEHDFRFQDIKQKICRKLLKLSQKIEMPCQYYINYLNTEIAKSPNDKWLLENKKADIQKIKMTINDVKINLKSASPSVNLGDSIQSIKDALISLESDDIKRNLCKKRISTFDKFFVALICWIDGKQSPRGNYIGDLVSSESSENDLSSNDDSHQHAPNYENDMEVVIKEAEKKHSTLFTLYNFFVSPSQGEKTIKVIENVAENAGISVDKKHSP